MKSKVVFLIISILLLVIVANDNTKSQDSCISTNIIFTTQVEYSEIEGITEELDNIEELLVSENDFGCEYYYTAELTYDPSLHTLERVLTSLGSLQGVIHVEEDSKLYSNKIPDKITDPYLSKQWYMDQIGAPSAWELLDCEPGEDVVVAVIDTGVNYNHPDLKNNMWVNEAENNGRSGFDDDGNGYIDDIYGLNLVTGSTNYNVRKNDPNDNDPDGHGTHVAGVIAMSAGNGGGAGIAYGSRIMAIKAANSKGEFTVSSIVSAVNYAIEMGAKVINMSFGSYTDSAVLKSTLEKAYKTCVLVAAAGNDSLPNVDNGLTNAKNVYPASYPFVLGVMAGDESKEVTSWSNYNSLLYTNAEYEIVAPGDQIFSTVLGGRYSTMSGTSMATPMVSAAAAVLLSSLSDEIHDPVDYVFGQLISSSGETASKVGKTNENKTYPLLNLYDALTVKPGLSLGLSSIRYIPSTQNIEYSGSQLQEIDSGTEIFCGFNIRNVWRGAKDIRVNLSTTSNECQLVKADFTLEEMSACTTFEVLCTDYESLSFTVSGEAGTTYTIPLIFTITGVKSDDETVRFKEIYKENILVKMKDSRLDQFGEPTPLPITVVEESNTSIPELKQVKKVSVVKRDSTKRYRNHITWSAVKGADKYLIYVKYKKSGSFKKLATTKKTSYTHKYKKNRTVFYRLTATAKSNNKVATSPYSKVVRVKKRK